MPASGWLHFTEDLDYLRYITLEAHAAVILICRPSNYMPTDHRFISAASPRALVAVSRRRDIA